MTFKALVTDKGEDDKVSSEIREMDESQLPEGDVLVDVEYSTLNYKDGLALNGLANVARAFPHVAGIDFAGTVAQSDSPDYRTGDKVVLTGWGVGESHWGGYSQKARVKSGWLVPLPNGLTAQRAMALGTAGFTAMLCVIALEEHGLKPGAGDVVVTGAAGGVGSVAVAVLANLGHDVVASTGRESTHDYLRHLGAKAIIERKELSEAKQRPLRKARFAGAVDTVGSTTLATVLASMLPRTSVAACGLAGGMDLPTTVAPFILRGVNLLGINSVDVPFVPRTKAWERLARDLPMDKLDGMTNVVPLAKVPELGGQILKGQVRGRTVVDVNA